MQWFLTQEFKTDKDIVRTWGYNEFPPSNVWKATIKKGKSFVNQTNPDNSYKPLALAGYRYLPNYNGGMWEASLTIYHMSIAIVYVKTKQQAENLVQGYKKN